MKFNSTHFFIVLILFIVAGIGIARFYSEAKPSPYIELAQCIADSGATFYGAFWCPHCAEQKALFGSSHEFLPYVECSTPDRQNQTEVCIEAGIESYPTWDLADGTRIGGVQTREQLAELTGCQLPETQS